MDATTKKIVQLLSDDRIERRCAAAMVLAELKVKEAEAVDALGRCLADDNRVLQLYALEALAPIRSAKVAALVTPLLDSGDEEVRAAAAGILANQGTRASNTLVRELADAPPARRRAIVSLLAQRHDAEAVEQLLRLLPDPELGEYTLNALRSQVEQLSAPQTKALRDQALALLKDKALVAHPDGAGRAIRLLGYLGDPKSVPTILAFCAPKHPTALRVSAIAALRRPLAAASATDKAARELLHAADDPDPMLARAALDTLRGLKLPADATDRLLALAESPHAAARAFALDALGRAADPKIIKSLVEHLVGDDPAARDAAARSLSRLEGAAAPLIKALGQLDDPDKVAQVGRLLRRHREALKPKDRQAIAALAVDALEADRRTAPPLLDLLATVDPDGYREALVARAQTHRRAKRHAQAFALLRQLDSKRLLDDDARYSALVSGLCALPNKKELGRASRTTDPVLRLLVELLASGTNVAAKLKKERVLTPEDLFYVGFNFSESRDEDERELGQTLLAHLAQKSPRSKLGRSAKNKLRLMGLE